MKDKAKSLIILIIIMYTPPVFANPCLDSLMKSSNDHQIFSAIHKNDKARLSSLLESGAKVNIREGGFTPLTLAIYSNNISLVNTLLDNSGTDINLPNIYGETPLILAVSYLDNIETIKRFIKHPSIDINNAKNRHGQTALILASRNGRADIVRLLLDHPEIDVNASDNYGFTSLIMSITGGIKFEYLVESDTGYLEVLKLLLDREDIDVNYIDHDSQYDRSALMWTVLLNRSSAFFIELLSVPNMDINVRNNFGRTALMMAVIHGQTDTIFIMFQFKRTQFRLHLKDRDRKTVLDLAFEDRKPGVLELLVDINKKLQRQYRKELGVVTISPHSK